MALERRLYVGPSLRRLRRERGLTQSDMAADLEVSASYIALLERNHRPLSAEMLVRIAQTYKLDISGLTGGSGTDEAARLRICNDPLSTHGLGLAEALSLARSLGCTSSIRIFGVQPFDLSPVPGLSAQMLAVFPDLLAALENALPREAGSTSRRSQG